MTDVPADAQRVLVTIDSYVIDSKEPEKEYGSWFEDWSCSVKSVTLTERKPGPEEDVFLIAKGDKAHVLTVEHNEGDSFGTASGKLEVIHVFADGMAAKAAQDAYLTSETGSPFDFLDDFGRRILMSDPVSLDSVSNTRRDVEIVVMDIVP